MIKVGQAARARDRANRRGDALVRRTELSRAALIPLQAHDRTALLVADNARIFAPVVREEDTRRQPIHGFDAATRSTR